MGWNNVLNLITSCFARMSGPLSFISKILLEIFWEKSLKPAASLVIKKQKAKDYEEANTADERVGAFNDLP